MSPAARRRTASGSLTAMARGFGAILVCACASVVPATIGASAAGAADPNPDPLVLTIDSLSPSVLTPDVLDGKRVDRAVVRIKGTVTNTSDVTWTDINLHPYIASAPITRAADLTAATAPNAESFIERIVDPGSFDNVAQLGPGESTAYSIKISEAALDISGATGVYPFGVHALGTNPEGRDDVADGHARTFLPLVGKRQPVYDMALVLPVRHDVRYAANGSVGRIGQWLADLSPDGDLDRLLSLRDAIGAQPVTWLIDPAVVDAIVRLSQGNPPVSLAATLTPEEGDPGSESTDEPTTASTTAVEVDLATMASDWLQRALPNWRRDTLLTLPYGDVDLSATTALDPDLMTTAWTLGTSWWRGEWAGSSLKVTPAVAPAAGGTTIQALATAPRDAVSLIDRAAVTLRNPRGDYPSIVTIDGRQVLVPRQALMAGGPGPDQRSAGVAVRQRLLAQTWVLSSKATPSAVILPTTWAPKASQASDFVAGLASSGLVRLVSLASVQSQPANAPSASLQQTVRSVEKQIDPETMDTTRQLIDSGSSLEHTLTLNDHVGTVITQHALTGIGYLDRVGQRASRLSSLRQLVWVGTQLRHIKISAPASVTLLSESGRFSAIITNDLAEPVTVGVTSDDSVVDVRGPDILELPANGRTSVVINISSTEGGLHNVRLTLTDSTGHPLPSTVTVPVRSSQVSRVIWVVMAGGFVIFVGAIAVRVWRTVRRSAATRGKIDG